MNRFYKIMSAGLASACIAGVAQAAPSLSFMETLHAALIEDPFEQADVPAGAFTVSIMIDSTEDLQGAEFSLTAPATGYFQYPSAFDNDAPAPASGPAAAQDSYVDMPSGSALILDAAGGFNDPSVGDSFVYGDLTQDPNQIGFKIFHATLLGFDPASETGTLAGRVTYRGATATEEVLFNYTFGLSTLTGDLNGDGFVGQDDLNIVLGAWGTNVTPGDPLAGDPSGDGFVGQDDLNDVLAGWGQGTPPSNLIPEPASAALLALGGLAMLRRRRPAV